MNLHNHRCPSPSVTSKSVDFPQRFIILPSRLAAEVCGIFPPSTFQFSRGLGDVLVLFVFVEHVKDQKIRQEQVEEYQDNDIAYRINNPNVTSCYGKHNQTVFPHPYIHMMIQGTAKSSLCQTNLPTNNEHSGQWGSC